MTVKELKEEVKALPESADDYIVYFKVERDTEPEKVMFIVDEIFERLTLW